MFVSEQDKREFLHKQKLEVHLGVQNAKVTCGHCKRRVLIRQAYRCYHCRLWFCWTCAGVHVKRYVVR